jgi:hypothetical protein
MKAENFFFFFYLWFVYILHSTLFFFFSCVSCNWSAPFSKFLLFLSLSNCCDYLFKDPLVFFNQFDDMQAQLVCISPQFRSVLL